MENINKVYKLINSVGFYNYVIVLKENVPATYSYGSEKILSIYSTTKRKNDKANVAKDQNVGKSL